MPQWKVQCISLLISNLYCYLIASASGYPTISNLLEGDPVSIEFLIFLIAPRKLGSVLLFDNSPFCFLITVKSQSQISIEYTMRLTMYQINVPTRHIPECLLVKEGEGRPLWAHEPYVLHTLYASICSEIFKSLRVLQFACHGWYNLKMVWTSRGPRE